MFSLSLAIQSPKEFSHDTDKDKSSCDYTYAFNVPEVVQLFYVMLMKRVYVTPTVKDHVEFLGSTRLRLTTSPPLNIAVRESGTLGLLCSTRI
jgi:hypothetical protein